MRYTLKNAKTGTARAWVAKTSRGFSKSQIREQVETLRAMGEPIAAAARLSLLNR